MDDYKAILIASDTEKKEIVYYITNRYGKSIKRTMHVSDNTLKCWLIMWRDQCLIDRDELGRICFHFDKQF